VVAAHPAQAVGDLGRSTPCRPRRRGSALAPGTKALVLLVALLEHVPERRLHRRRRRVLGAPGRCR
jgi:hypothetical protein